MENNNKQAEIKSKQRIGNIIVVIGLVIRMIAFFTMDGMTERIIGNGAFLLALIISVPFYIKAKHLKDGDSKSAFDKLDDEK